MAEFDRETVERLAALEARVEGIDTRLISIGSDLATIRECQLCEMRDAAKQLKLQPRVGFVAGISATISFLWMVIAIAAKITWDHVMQ